MSEINKYGFLNSLINIINTEEEDNLKVVIAKYLLENFERIHQLNIYEVADQCFVTRESVRRFSQSIGFDNFRDLKADPNHYRYYHSTDDIDNYPAYLSNQLSEMTEDCNKCLETELEQILSHISVCSQIIFLVSDIYSSRCIEFQKGMILSGKMVRIVSCKFKDHKLLNAISADDLLITVSVSGDFATQMNQFVQEFNCRKMLLTAMHDPMFHSVYDLVLHLGSKEPTSIKTIYHLFSIEYYLDVLYNEHCKRHIR